MKFNSLLSVGLTIVILTIFSSCDKKEKEDPIIPNEEELITSLYFTLIDTLANDTVLFSFKDLDGDGGNDPEIINGELQANTNYIGKIGLYNESVDPRENITIEIQNEADHHQFFFIVSTALNFQIEYNDSDSNGNPLGIENTIETGEGSVGELLIILRHNPNKTAAGVSEGIITNAGGESDIEVTFELTIL